MEQIEDSEKKKMLSKWLSNLWQRWKNIQWREDMKLYRCYWNILRDKNKRMKLRHSLLLFTAKSYLIACDAID